MTDTTDQLTPVVVTGEVTVTRTVHPEPRYITTRTQTFILAAGDPSGPQLIRPRTKQDCHTVIMPMPVPGGTSAGYGWIANTGGDAQKQKGCLVRGDGTGPIELIGQNELWCMADPASATVLYIAVYTEIEGTN